MPKKRYMQIDVLKGIAMWMILINHSHNYVYSSELLFKLSRSCVQIMLFCAGINAALKLRAVFVEAKSDKSIVPVLWRRFWWPQLVSILVPYFVFNASFLFLWKRFIDLATMWQYFIGFNIANPVYFIPVYFELILTAPFMYYLVCRFKTKMWSLALGIVSLVVCVWLAGHTYMFPIYGAGQYLFGATYGWTFILGMMFGNKLRSDKANPYIGSVISISIGALIVWVISLKLFPDAHTKLEQIFSNIGGNPPGLDSMIEGFLLIWLIWTIITFAESKLGNSKTVHFLTSPLISCGKYSLYIFLWHMFVKAAWNQVIAAVNFPKQSLLYAIPFYFGSTVGVILVKKAFDYVKKDLVLTCLKNGE